MDSPIGEKLYKIHDIWKKLSDDCMIRYRCYELLGKESFCIQSADYFYLPITTEKLLDSEKQQVELFMDMMPDDRSELYDSILDAIKAHDLEFI